MFWGLHWEGSTLTSALRVFAPLHHARFLRPSIIHPKFPPPFPQKHKLGLMPLVVMVEDNKFSY